MSGKQGSLDLFAFLKQFHLNVNGKAKGTLAQFWHRSLDSIDIQADIDYDESADLFTIRVKSKNNRTKVEITFNAKESFHNVFSSSTLDIETDKFTIRGTAKFANIIYSGKYFYNLGILRTNEAQINADKQFYLGLWGKLYVKNTYIDSNYISIYGSLHAIDTMQTTCLLFYTGPFAVVTGSNRSIEALISINMLGITTAYNQDITSILDVNLGVRLMQLPNSLNNLITPSRILGIASAVAKSLNLPVARSLNFFSKFLLWGMLCSVIIKNMYAHTRQFVSAIIKSPFNLFRLMGSARLRYALSAVLYMRNTRTVTLDLLQEVVQVSLDDSINLELTPNQIIKNIVRTFLPVENVSSYASMQGPVITGNVSRLCDYELDSVTICYSHNGSSTFIVSGPIYSCYTTLRSEGSVFLFGESKALIASYSAKNNIDFTCAELRGFSPNSIMHALFPDANMVNMQADGDVIGDYGTLIAGPVFIKAKGKVFLPKTLCSESGHIIAGSNVELPLSGRVRNTSIISEGKALVPLGATTVYEKSTLETKDCIIASTIDSSQLMVIVKNELHIIKSGNFAARNLASEFKKFVNNGVFRSYNVTLAVDQFYNKGEIEGDALAFLAKTFTNQGKVNLDTRITGYCDVADITGSISTSLIKLEADQKMTLDNARLEGDTIALEGNKIFVNWSAISANDALSLTFLYSHAYFSNISAPNITVNGFVFLNTGSLVRYFNLHKNVIVDMPLGVELPVQLPTLQSFLNPLKIISIANTLFNTTGNLFFKAIALFNNALQFKNAVTTLYSIRHANFRIRKTIGPVMDLKSVIESSAGILQSFKSEIPSVDAKVKPQLQFDKELLAKMLQSFGPSSHSNSLLTIAPFGILFNAQQNVWIRINAGVDFIVGSSVHSRFMCSIGSSIVLNSSISVDNLFLVGMNNFRRSAIKVGYLVNKAETYIDQSDVEFQLADLTYVDSALKISSSKVEANEIIYGDIKPECVESSKGDIADTVSAPQFVATDSDLNIKKLVTSDPNSSAYIIRSKMEGCNMHVGGRLNTKDVVWENCTVNFAGPTWSYSGTNLFEKCEYSDSSASSIIAMDATALFALNSGKEGLHAHHNGANIYFNMQNMSDADASDLLNGKGRFANITASNLFTLVVPNRVQLDPNNRKYLEVQADGLEIARGMHEKHMLKAVSMEYDLVLKPGSSICAKEDVTLAAAKKNVIAEVNVVRQGDTDNYSEFVEGAIVESGKEIAVVAKEGLIDFTSARTKSKDGTLLCAKVVFSGSTDARSKTTVHYADKNIKTWNIGYVTTPFVASHTVSHGTFVIASEDLSQFVGTQISANKSYIKVANGKHIEICAMSVASHEYISEVKKKTIFGPKKREENSINGTVTPAKPVTWDLKEESKVYASAGYEIEGSRYTNEINVIYVEAPFAAIKCAEHITQGSHVGSRSNKCWVSKRYATYNTVQGVNLEIAGKMIINAQNVFAEISDTQHPDYLTHIEVQVGQLAVKLKQSSYATEGERISAPTMEFAICLAIAIEAATLGTGTALATQIGLTAAAMQTAFASGFAALCSSATLAMLNNQGDIEKAVKSLANSGTAKNLAVSMLGAGIAKELSSIFKVTADAGKAARVIEQMKLSLAQSSVSTSLNIVVLKQKPSAAVKSGIVSSVVNVSYGTMGSEVRSNALQNRNAVGQCISHVSLGALAGAANKGKKGAIAGAIGSLTAQVVAHVDQNFDEGIVEQRSIEDLGRLYSDERNRHSVQGVAAAFTAFAVGEDITTAVQTARLTSEYYEPMQSRATNELIVEQASTQSMPTEIVDGIEDACVLQLPVDESIMLIGSSEGLDDQDVWFMPAFNSINEYSGPYFDPAGTRLGGLDIFNTYSTLGNVISPENQVLIYGGPLAAMYGNYWYKSSDIYNLGNYMASPYYVPQNMRYYSWNDVSALGYAQYAAAYSLHMTYRGTIGLFDHIAQAQVYGDPLTNPAAALMASMESMETQIEREFAYLSQGRSIDRFLDNPVQNAKEAILNHFKSGVEEYSRAMAIGDYSRAGRINASLHADVAEVVVCLAACSASGGAIGGAAIASFANRINKGVIRGTKVAVSSAATNALREPVLFSSGAAGRANLGKSGVVAEYGSKYLGKTEPVMGYGGGATVKNAENTVLFSKSAKMDFAPTGFKDGQFYPPDKLRQLYEYLHKRGADIQPIPLGAQGPGFRACDPRTGKPTLYLPENPTVLEVKHELSHYLDFKNMGIEKYSSLTRPQKEQMVLDRLKDNRIWKQVLTKQERKFSQKYVDKLRSENPLSNNLGGPNVD